MMPAPAPNEAVTAGLGAHHLRPRLAALQQREQTP